MNNNVISKIIMKKTGAYLWISLLLFLFSNILLSSSFTFIQYQYHQIQKDFIDNKNTHLVEVASSVDLKNPNKVCSLLFKDEQKISQLLADQVSPNILVYSEYCINFGVTGENENVYFIRGIDNLALKSLGLPPLNNDYAFCSQEMYNKNIILKLPVIQVENGGFSSKETVDSKILLTPISINVPPLDTLNIYSDTIYVNKNMFKNIIEAMYGMPWDSFVDHYDNGDSYGIQAINRIFVYVDKLSEVKTVAKILKDNGYDIDYTLGAFDDISKSIRSNYFAMGLMIFFIYIVTAANVIISFRGYITSMQKDMGILLHYGYSRDKVYSIYKRVILKPYFYMFTILIIFTFISSMLVLKNSFIVNFLITMSLLIFLTSTVIVILLSILHGVAKKSILYLIKASKDIE